MSDYPSQDLGTEGGGNGYPPEPSHEQTRMRPADTFRHGDAQRAPTPNYEPIPVLPVWQDQAPDGGRSSTRPNQIEEMTVEPMGADEGDWDDGPWNA